MNSPRAIRALVGALAASAIAFTATTATASAYFERSIPGQYVVSLQPRTDQAALLRSLGIRPTATYARIFNGFAAPLSPSQYEHLKANPSVIKIDIDTLIGRETQEIDPATDNWTSTPTSSTTGSPSATRTSAGGPSTPMTPRARASRCAPSTPTARRWPASSAGPVSGSPRRSASTR